MSTDEEDSPLQVRSAAWVPLTLHPRTVRIGPAVGLFVDLEVRFVDGPVFVGQPYLVEHKIVGIGQSRRVESYWTETTLTAADTGVHAATVLLHQGVFKASYADYPA